MDDTLMITVKVLKDILSSIPEEYDNSPVIIPVIDPDDSGHFIGSFRIIGTAGLVHEDGEINGGDALLFAPSSGRDVYSLLKDNGYVDTKCKQVLF